MMAGDIIRTGFARKLAAKRYRELGNIRRRNDIDNGRGGFMPQDPNNPWPVVTPNVPCRVDATARPNESTAGVQMTSESPYDISFPVATDVRNKDRVTVTSMSNRTFEITGPRYATDEVSRIMAAKEIT